MASKELAKTEPAANLPVSAELAAALGEMAGAGFDQTTKDDYALPFLHVLQKMSPQVDKHDPKYVAGAEPGKFMNTVTQEVLDGDAGIVVIPVDFRKVFLEWVPRDAGGGLVAEFATKEEAELKKSQDKKTDIVDTANHYLLVKTSLGWEAVVLSCTSTKLKASRNWMSLMARVQINSKPAPMFAKKYLLKTILQSNDKGSYFNIKAEPIDGPDGWVTADELREAMTFFKQIRSGQRSIEFSKLDADGPIVPVGDEETEF